MNSKADSSKELVLTRTFHAPRELVFKAFTEPERLAHWWGPVGFKLIVAQLDLKPGGTFLYGMRSPDGAEMWGKFVYHEIVFPERITFVNSFSDKEGNIIRAPFSETWPLEIFNTWTLSELDGTTTVTLRGKPYQATAAEIKAFEDGFPSLQQGFGGTFRQLDAYLASL